MAARSVDAHYSISHEGQEMIREEDKAALRKFYIQVFIIFICVSVVSAYCLIPGG